MPRSARYLPLVRLLVAASFVALAIASPAFAYDEPNTINGNACANCHDALGDNPSGGVCVDCHGGAYEGGASRGEGFNPADTSGPHGGYTAATRKCATCHTTHDSPAAVLLPAATIYETCFTCHDGSGGWGVYGTLAARGVAVGGGHRYEATSTVPGGDALSGGSASAVFEGGGGKLTCSDCHSPHGSSVVAEFTGERRRLRGTNNYTFADYRSTRLLRRTPTGAPASVDEYGSDWCLGCHKGRDSGGAVHNHPVESEVTYADDGSRFLYRRLAILNRSVAATGTFIGQLAGNPSSTNVHDDSPGGVVTNTSGNHGYLMPWPRSTGASGQSGHNPICQQCHEDSRDLGDLADDGSATAVAFNTPYADSVTWNGSAWVTSTVGNPRFQNFPHETENTRMLVETADDLCMNCHPPTALP